MSLSERRLNVTRKLGIKCRVNAHNVQLKETRLHKETIIRGRGNKGQMNLSRDLDWYAQIHIHSQTNQLLYKGERICARVNEFVQG